MEIRDARPEDFDGIVPLIRAFYELDRHPFDPDLVESGLRPLLDGTAPGFVLVADDDGELLAYAVVTWGWAIESGGRDALLDEIYVSDRSRGIGAEMMYRLMERSRDAGCRRMFLETESHNRQARIFYTRHGFDIDDSVWMSRDL
ncbi:MAG TPA: GNAT family N-acetyltransferase [Acidimicrobiia bacterium]|nr:GNAT family N-acetyltransferase [Acidimicrobiia bacterium]